MNYNPDSITPVKLWN